MVKTVKTVNKIKKAVIFNTGHGGIGKIIQSTALIKPIKAKYKNCDLHLITPHTDIYINNPHITALYAPHQFMYDNLVKQYGQENITYLNADPYMNYKYQNKLDKTHIIQIWGEMLGLKISKAQITPELFLSAMEKEQVEREIGQFGAETVLLHLDGGARDHKTKQKKIMFARDLPNYSAQQVINMLNQLGLKVIYIWKDGQAELNGALKATFNTTRELITFISGVHHIISIDTCTQHIAKAFNKKALVLWGATNPYKLGYESNTNLTNECTNKENGCVNHCGRPDSYISDINPTQRAYICPKGNPCCDHDALTILEAFTQLKEYN